MRGGERDLHEMRVLELAVTGEVVNDGNLSGRFGLGLGPNFGPLRTGFDSVFTSLWDLQLRRCSSPGTGSDRHFLFAAKIWTARNRV